jgi:hypothetical protein
LARRCYFHIDETYVKGRSEIIDAKLNDSTRKSVELDHSPDTVQLYLDLIKDGVIPVLGFWKYCECRPQLRMLFELLLLTGAIKDIHAQNVTTAAIVAAAQNTADPFLCTETISIIYNRTTAGSICRKMVAHLVRDKGMSHWYSAW